MTMRLVLLNEIVGESKRQLEEEFSTVFDDRKAKRIVSEIQTTRLSKETTTCLNRG